VPIITVSRGTMSGGKALAECVAGALGCPCIAREVLLEGASKLGVSEEHLREGMERSPGLWDRFTAERRTYVLACQATLAEHAARNDFVYHGLAGHLLLRDLPEVLRVRLIAPLEMRIHALMEQRGMVREQAERYIADVDQHRARWSRLMYDAEIGDPRLYDLVLNLEKASLESACAAVVALARRREFTIDEAARARCADFALACRVRLALDLHPSSRGLGLGVAAREGRVTLTGQIPQAQLASHATERWMGELRRVAEAVPDVKQVDLKVEVVRGYR
jgi:cytidylate kinase